MNPVTGGAPAGLSRSWKAGIIGAASLAFFLKIAIALSTYGTNDLYRYEGFAIWSRHLGVGVYRYLWQLNQAPSVLHALRALLWAAGATHLPFQFWLRLPGILADAGSVCLVCLTLRARRAEPAISLAIVFFALSPIGIMISGFHGSIDPVMTFFTLLAVYCAQRFSGGWAAGAALALAICCKVVPLILVPAFLLYLNGARRKFQFVATGALVTLVAWSPYIFQDPHAVANQVFGYRSLPGIWGPSWLLARLAGVIPEYGRFYSWYQSFSLWPLFALLAGLAFSMNRLRSKCDLLAQTGVILLVFVTFVNGFGVQYLAWIAPWTVVLGASIAGAFFVTGGLFLFAVYNYWSEGLPWYLADSHRIGGWHGSIEILQLLCWLSVAAAAWLAWKRIGAPAFSLRPAARAFVYAPAVLAIALTIDRTTQQDIVRHSWEGSGQAAVAAIRAGTYADVSAQLNRMGLYAESIAAARAALAIKPDLPMAYSSIAADEAALRRR